MDKFHLLSSLFFLSAAVLAGTPSVPKPTASPMSTIEEEDAGEAEDSLDVDVTPSPPNTKTGIQGTVASGNSAAQDEDNQPFENVLDPHSNSDRLWTLWMSNSYGWETKDSSSYTFTGSISRALEAESFSLTPRLGWSRQTAKPSDTLIQNLSLGAYLQWEPTADLGLGLDGDWITQNGPDDGKLEADASFDHNLTDWLNASVAASGGWSILYRGSAGGSIGSLVTLGEFQFSVNGSFNRRLQTYVNILGVQKEDYTNAWGWTTGLNWKKGHWTTGPSWTGEYWKANTSANQKISDPTSKSKGKKNVKVVKISASGVVIDESVAWNWEWKPIPDLAFEFSLIKNFGQSSATAKANQPNPKPVAGTNPESPTFPENSVVGTLGFAFHW